jgi:hypothetical protein
MREQTAHLLAALLSESIKALAAQLQLLVALGVAQLLVVYQAVGALVVAGDAVEGDPSRDGALPVDPALCAELDRRWANHRDNPEAAVPWDEVRSQLGIE